MLGPIVALLLLTSPAAGPVDQACWLLCSDSGSSGPSVGERLQQQQAQQALQDLQERVRRIEWEQSLPPRTPVVPPYGSGSSSSPTSSLDCHIQKTC